jgi:lipid-binding SYLF domain-containing protein
MSSPRRSFHFAIGAVLGVALILGSQTAFAAEKPEDDEPSIKEARGALKAFKDEDPDLQAQLDKAAGYVVFPTVGKAGVVVGGGGGEGILFENGAPAGRVKLTLINVGAQVGGQHFRELVILQNKDAVDRFKRGNFAFQAGLTAVAAGAGASANLNFRDGVAVITKTTGGAMIGATVAGQRFSYSPLAKPTPPQT